MTPKPSAGSSIRRLLIALVTVSLLAISLAPVALAKPGGSNAAGSAACANGGYLNWKTTAGATFKNEGDCTKYTAKGGVLVAVNPCGHAQDTALAGKTIYAISYTNVDGVAGYSAAGCDVFHLAFVEDSGDTTPGAGDLLLLGRRPTLFDPPYNFVAFSGTSTDVAGILCFGPQHVSVSRAPAGTGGSEFRANTSNFETSSSNIDETGLNAFNAEDWVGSSINDQIPGAERVDPADNAFLEVDVLFTCDVGG